VADSAGYRYVSI